MFLSVLIAGRSFGDDKPEQPDRSALGAGDHELTLTIDGRERDYLVHVPEKYDPQKPTPVVLALHGVTMDGSIMARFSGLNSKSDEAGFIVVYPSGAGKKPLLYWNAGGGWDGFGKAPDDVAFIGKLLDDLAGVVNVDQKRVYACGMSNGAMMCYRLASEMSDRIAAIAAVAGTIAIPESDPKRPVPVIHFHGTNDKMVPFETAEGKFRSSLRGTTVDGSIQTWIRLNACDCDSKAIDVLSKPDDELKVTRTCYGPGKNGAEVVLVVVEGGGHTWPGRKPRFRGKSALNVSANDLIWQFFEKHPLK
ncbi:MAG: dienelactone hydrolase family protein [Planctomycetia bacterium]|nr:dienelactone hydrolase family protein [Planctomycetia bacterium]